MKNFKFGSFIELDEGLSLKSLQSSRERYAFSDAGQIIYSIGIPIPVIEKRRRCIGIAIPEKIVMTAESTKVIFSFEEVSKEAQIVFYNLYKNSVTMKADTERDIYDADITIPGAVSSPGIDMARNISSETLSKREKQRLMRHLRGESIPSLLDDEDDDY